MKEKFGFELINGQEISEYRTHAMLFRHIKTGAQLLSLQNQDENKVFGISFRTPPNDSTGIAHIMEHSVLCGSEKYPLKEPFIELVKGSLNTFINAFTYPDKTCYPVASQNVKDFYNLVDVYIDAVFHPLIPETTLQQEGWHYELENPDDPLVYKGVVFNEMKGAYSNPEDILEDKARMSLFPDTPYSVDSGGDPLHIPELTYPQFRTFHERYYHPSNAFIYFYGDDDPEERLRIMNEALTNFKPLQVESEIPLQPVFENPRREIIYFDPGDEEESNKGMLVMNWLLAEASDPITSLGYQILTHILVGSIASPLRKALIDSGLGEDLAGVGLENELRQVYFSTGLRGIKADEKGNLPAEKEIEALILQTLENLAREGIDPAMVSASLNTVEFRLRENNTGSFPQGLLLMLRSLTAWLYDRDPFEPLSFEKPLNAIKKQVSEGIPFFENLIKRFFLENRHRTTVVLKPKPGLQKQRNDEEKEKLARIKSQLKQTEISEIINQTVVLKEIQQRPDTPEVLAKIPSLSLADLDKKVKIIPLEELKIADTVMLYHDLFTNGIFYLDLGFDLHALPKDLVPYVPLFGRALLEMGTIREDYVQLSQHIGRSTGGISPATFSAMVRDSDDAVVRLFLRSKAIPGQVPELLKILEEILFTVQLDNPERFRQIALEKKAGIEAMLAPAGHRVVNSRIRAIYNEADWAAEQMQGVSQLFFVRDLIRQIDSNWPLVLNKLEEIRHTLLNRQRMIFNLTLDEASWNELQSQIHEFLERIPSDVRLHESWSRSDGVRFEGLSIPAQVNYVGKGANLYELGYKPDGSIEVITNYLRTSWLWERVRVQGGAYGGFCLFDQDSGVFTFLSYRDPNLLLTLENFDLTSKFLYEIQLDQEELKKSIIGAIGDMDAYQLPDAKGYSSLLRYLKRESDHDRQAWRDQILSTSLSDFHELGTALDRVNKTGSVVVMGSPEALSKANSERGPWLQINKIL